MFQRAITRIPGANFTSGLTTASLGAPDYERMLRQHQAYVATLRSLGLVVDELAELPDFPDAYFVEDVAVVVPEVAVITRPGAIQRLGEAEHIVDALAKYRPTRHIEAPGTLDGGDVLQINNHVYIGVSARSNEHGAQQLGTILTAYDYAWTAVPVVGSLHLKSDVNYIGRNTLLLSPSYATMELFSAYDKIIVDADEAYAANTLLVNDKLLHPVGYPKTKEKLLATGFEIIAMVTGEIQKMDGGLSCMSLRF